MRVLLLGKNGQVGQALQRALIGSGEVIALDRASTHQCGDLADLSGLARTLQAVVPDIILNAAAYAAVDRAEDETVLAHAVNAEAPALLAEHARRHGCLLVQYSTDYVFDGEGSRPWTEEDEPRPLNVYGHSKLAGERAIRASGADHLILRTSWVYAQDGQNFMTTMLRLGAERERLDVVNDQYGAPTHAGWLAELTTELMAAAYADRALGGLYHCVPAGETTWFQYAGLIFDEAKAGGVRLKLQQLTPVSSAAYPSRARRPQNSRLATDKITRTFGVTLPHWSRDVKTTVQSLARSLS